MTNTMKIKVNEIVMQKAYLLEQINPHLEWGGFLFGSMVNNTLLVEDIILCKQTIGFGDFNTEHDEVAATIHYHMDKIAEMNKFRKYVRIGWIHSHNDMGAFLSGTDSNQIDSFIKENNAISHDIPLVSIVVANISSKNSMGITIKATDKKVATKAIHFRLWITFNDMRHFEMPLELLDINISDNFFEISEEMAQATTNDYNELVTIRPVITIKKQYATAAPQFYWNNDYDIDDDCPHGDREDYCDICSFENCMHSILIKDCPDCTLEEYECRDCNKDLIACQCYEICNTCGSNNVYCTCKDCEICENCDQFIVDCICNCEDCGAILENCMCYAPLNHH